MGGEGLRRMWGNYQRSQRVRRGRFGEDKIRVLFAAACGKEGRYVQEILLDESLTWAGLNGATALRHLLRRQAQDKAMCLADTDVFFDIALKHAHAKAQDELGISFTIFNSFTQTLRVLECRTSSLSAPQLRAH